MRCRSLPWIGRRLLAGCSRLAALALGAAALLSCAAAPARGEQSGLRPYRTWIPSTRPSGIQANDRVWLTFYPPSGGSKPAPAVVIAHSLGEDRPGFVHRHLHALARRFAAHGIGGAVLELPYHMARKVRGVNPVRLFTSTDVRNARALLQGASDICAAAAWLRRHPLIDPARVGVLGVSLGAILAHMAMGEDPLLRAGVALLGGGDLPRIQEASLLVRILHPRQSLNGGVQEELAREADPLRFAHMNRPRRVLMVQAARDDIIPPSAAKALWEALGKPPIRWLDINHFGLITAIGDVAKASEAFLTQVWSGVAPGKERIPPVQPLTLKGGILWEPGRGPEAAVQWQALSLGARPDHMPILGLNLGFSWRGPFAAPALTVNRYIDAGMAVRPSGGRLKPYLSFHLTL